MKLNKTLMMTALMAGSLWTGGMALQAQDTPTTNTPSQTPPPAPRMRAGFDGMAKQLNLTDDQKTKAKPIFEDMQTQMRDLRADTTLSTAEKRAKMKDIREATTAKLKDILTPEQLAKWQKMGPGNRRPPTTPPSAEGTTPPSTSAPPANN
jgi:Spy/CpxP family protein refolding chaperone